MMTEEPSSLASYVTGLLASGRVIFSPEAAQNALGIGGGAFLDAAERLQKKRLVFRPRHGFYVAVPPQYLNIGCPPPTWFIDALMQHDDAPYYVGLLKAAEIHGAAHQAVMEFQVVTTKQLKQIKAGRARIGFYFRKDFTAIADGIGEHKTDTGTMKISSPELTLLDLFRYSRASGGLDNIVTVLDDLAPKVDPQKLPALGAGFEQSVVQRAGYLLEKFGFAGHGEALHGILNKIPMPWIELERPSAQARDLATDAIERNKRWRVIIRREPERDQ
jgi:predicted transcriptional regulator of viral defense system